MSRRLSVRTLWVNLLVALALVVPLAAQTSPAAAADNPITIENQLPGSPASEWDVSGAGDSSIQGFSTDVSVNVGTTVEFKIDTPSSDYRIDIYRLGWYGGDGARKVATIENADITKATQPGCVREPAPDNLLDCGNWTVSATWQVPADAVSGVYLARPARQDAGNEGKASHIPFIVRDDASRSQVSFQASVTTWQAYNEYGGVNLYGYRGTTHAHKVSFNRPLTVRGTEPHESLFNAEYPMLRWLERNGYDVSYTTNVDTDRHGDLVKNHNVFLSVGHDEYWSKGARDAVEAARDDTADPTNLAFFSGNEVYWRIRWEDDHRTMVSYKEGDAAGSVEHYDCFGNFACDPSGEWTGLWRQDPDYAPENALTGQISWRDDTVAMKVPAQYADRRFWRDTPVAGLSSGEATLAAGTVGYEWNPEQPAYASSYPKGRVLLSGTTISGDQHHLSLHRADSSALTFGAGTVQWAWGLDASASTPQASENATQQQATANLLADLGATANTLQSGLTQPTPVTDTQAPTVTITSPTAGATVPGGTVTIAGTAADVGGGAVGVVEVSVGGDTWQRATGTSNWQASVPVPASGSVTARVRAADDMANLGEPVTVTFSVGDRVCAQDAPCSVFGDAVTGVQEADNGAVELGMKFRAATDGFVTGVRFYKTAGNTGTHTGRVYGPDGTVLGRVTFTGETATGWQRAEFDQPVAITANTTYLVSYHTTSGNYAIGSKFTAAVNSPPLTGLADGTDGPNGVFAYGAGGTRPTQSWQASNYLVDVLFATTATPGEDTTAPTVVSRAPSPGATRVAPNSPVVVDFSEPLDPASVTASTITLRAGATAVAATVTWDAATRRATLTPSAALTPGTLYTVTVVGGSSGVRDVAGNPLATDDAWTFTTAQPSQVRPDPNAGPGGPILVIGGNGSHGAYLPEILRAEGLNLFAVGSLGDLTAAGLADYRTVLLGETTLTGDQVIALTTWVNRGGDLIAIRPDPALATLLGLTATSDDLSEGYLKVDTASAPGAGIVSMAMQFHGTADLYTAGAGVQQVAALYRTSTTTADRPAVTTRVVGSAGGSASAFTYNLAESIVLTRQGNPAWTNQNRDGQAGPNRGNDLFYGAMTGDVQPDWVDRALIGVPQADEQQRLLANLITEVSRDAMPLPRFWYLPRGENAAVVMTADNHNGGSVTARFNAELAASPAGCSVEDWECIRSTGYLYADTPQLTTAQATTYQNQGFEIALHPNTGCASPTEAQFTTQLADQLAELAGNFPDLIAPTTNRNHCIAWSDWTVVPKVGAAQGIHLDTNYYFWPPAWVNDTPGVFTGSGFAQRFANRSGELIDAYQATTQMTDESGQTYPRTAEVLLDRALGAEGYYGTFVANIHTDGSTESQAAAIVAAAKARGVPVISAAQLLEWTDARNASAFGDVAFADGALTFSVSTAAGANGLQAMVPIAGPAGELQRVTAGGSPVTTQERTVKGERYAVFTAVAGSYRAEYGADSEGPVITSVTAAPTGSDAATVTWTTNEPATSQVEYGTSPNSLTSVAEASGLVAGHSVPLTGLQSDTEYFYRVASVDAAGNSATHPVPPAAPLRFRTSGTVATDNTVADFTAGTTNSMVVTDIAGGEVSLAPTMGLDGSSATPAGWTTAPWSSGGATTATDGRLRIDGALLAADDSSGPGRSIEFVGSFGGANFQHIGFGVDMNNVARWAIFSTHNTGGSSVYARTNNNGVTSDTVLPGVTPGTPHRYRIDWLADSVVFRVDGVVVHTENVTIADPMRPVVSDFAVGSAAVTLDWLRLAPYSTSGDFTSRVHDAGARADWGTFDYAADLPAGTELSFEVRGGDTATPDGTWTAFAPIALGDDIPVRGQYLQYRMRADTSDALVTPTLESVTLPYTVIVDTNPPTVTTRVPAVDATGVAINADVVVTFSEPVDAPTGSATLRAAGAAADFPAVVTLDGNTLTLNPTGNLAYSTTYTVTLTGSITDLAGNALAGETWSFTTADPPPPPTYAVTVTGGTTNKTQAAQGETVTITATVPTGKVFSSWTVTAGGVTLTNANAATTTFTMGTAPVAVTANFVDAPPPKYAVTITGGTTNKTQAAQGESVTITATVPAGKMFSNWTVTSGGVTLTNTNAATTTFTMGTQPVAVTANFVDAPPPTYAVTVTGGTTNKAQAAQGELVTITATVPTGKVFSSWTVTAGGVTLTNANAATTTFTMGTQPVAVTANFVDAPPPKYAVTVTGGTTNKAQAAQGEQVTITATVPAGKVFSGWTVTAGGVTLANTNAATTTFTMGTTPVAITANFADAKYAVTVTSGTTNKTQAAQGEQVTITATVPTGKVFSNWTVTAGGVTLTNANAATTTFTMGTTPVAITANFVDAPTVTAYSAGTKRVGEATNAWGTVSGVTGATTAWTEALVNGNWSRSQTVTSDASGFFVIPLTYGTNTPATYTFRVGATTPSGTVYSDSFTLERVAYVTASSAGSKRVGEATNAWGTVHGAANTSAWTEAYVNGRWSRSQTVTTDGSGNFVIPLTYGTNTAGSYTFRVGAATPSGTVYSDSLTLERVAYVTASSAGTKRIGEATSTWGYVHGAPNVTAFTEVYVNGRWARSQTVTTDASGWFVIPLTYGTSTPGSYTFRVGAVTVNGTVYSASFQLTRTS